MKQRNSKAIVVDASVVRSAGMTENPTSIHCREVLQTMLDYCHRVVLSTDVNQELRKHASRFARLWLGSMTAKKKLLLVTDSGAYSELYGRVEACLEEAKQQEAVSKDFHLVVAAFESDKIIITRDERLCKILDAAAGQVEELRSLIFANPDATEQQVADWLNRGAPAERTRRVGYRGRRHA